MVSRSVFCIVLAFSATAFAQKDRPCDLLAAKTPCVAAHSTTRALYSAYKGPLYEVTNWHNKKTMDIKQLADGYADTAPQVKFCLHSTCSITKIYDQSPNHNDLTPAPPGGYSRGPGPDGHDIAAVADALPLTVGGHPVFGILVDPGTGYRNDKTTKIPVNGQPEGVYMVTSALHLNDRCCFDYGNAETNDLDNKHGHMDAINIMNHEKGPNAGLDMEDGIPGHHPVPAGTTFVTVLGGNDGQHKYAMYQGNAQSGPLTSTGVIPLPDVYQPMKQEGAIILGIGGDNSNSATGYFFEGVMTEGMPDADAMNAVQANVVAAKYDGTLKP